MRKVNFMPLLLLLILVLESWSASLVFHDGSGLCVAGDEYNQSTGAIIQQMLDDAQPGDVLTICARTTGVYDVARLSVRDNAFNSGGIIVQGEVDGSGTPTTILNGDPSTAARDLIRLEPGVLSSGAITFKNLILQGGFTSTSDGAAVNVVGPFLPAPEPPDTTPQSPPPPPANPAPLNVTFDNVHFKNNSVDDQNGGAIGMGLLDPDYYSGTFNVTGCRFENNTATGTGDPSGGAIYAIDGHTLNIQNSIFQDNRAALGAAVYAVGNLNIDTDLGLTDKSVFESNTASQNASAIFLKNGIVTAKMTIGNSQNVLLPRTRFSDNLAQKQGYVWHLEKTEATVFNVQINGNRLGPDESSPPQESEDLGLIWAFGSSELHILNSEIFDNENLYGNSLFLYMNGTIINSLIYENNLAGVLLQPSNRGLSIINTTVYNNRPADPMPSITTLTTIGTSPPIGEGSLPRAIYNSIFWNDADGDPLTYEENVSSLAGCDYTNWTVSHNIVQGCPLEDETKKVTSEDPQVINSTTEPFDFSLDKTQLNPAIEGGVNGVNTSATDLAGNPRVVGPNIDLGAYEHQNPGFKLTINIQGSGTVQQDPQPDENGLYENGTIVTLTAVPASGWDFDEWSGDATGEVSPITLTMNGSKTVTATFEPLTFSIFTTANGCGSISPPDDIEDKVGEIYTFQFLPDPLCRLTEVLVNGASNPAATSLEQITLTIIPQDQTLVANFAPIGELPFFDGFEDGLVTDEWVLTDPGASVTHVNRSNNNQALSIFSSSTGGEGITTRFENNTPDFISFDVFIPQGSGSSEAFFELSDAAGNFTPAIFTFEETGQICTGTGGACLNGYALDTWHNIDIRLAWNAGSLITEWFVDGVNVNTAQHGCTDCADGAELILNFLSRTTSAGTVSNVLFDNVKVGFEYRLSISPTPVNGDVEVFSWDRIETGPEYVYRYFRKGVFPVATLNADADPGFGVVGWQVNAETGLFPEEEVVNLDMNGDKTVTATFGSTSNDLTIIWPDSDPAQETTITLDDNVPVQIFDLLPESFQDPDKMAFSHWERVEGSGIVKISKDQQTISVTDGDVVISAVFDTAFVQVWFKESRQWDPDSGFSKPLMRIKNLGKVDIEGGFKLRYYFKVECFFPPEADWPGLPEFWMHDTVTGIQDGDDYIDNFYVDLYYTQTLARGETVDQPEGFFLTYTEDCTDPKCAIWETENDPSQQWNSIFLSQDGFRRNQYILACYLDDWDCNNPINKGVVPPMTHDPAPDQPPRGDNVPFFDSDPHFGPIAQLPNITLAQGFDLGTMLVNGSFEEGTAHWKTYPIDASPPAEFDVIHHSEELNTYDGDKSAQVLPQAADEVEGIVYEFHEDEPGYAQILSTPENQGVVFSAWVRGVEGTPTGGVQVAVIADGAPVPGGVVTVNGGANGWQFVQHHFQPNDVAPDADGVMRFAILEDVLDGTQNPGFLVDGVTLTPGKVYAAPSLNYTYTNTRSAKIQNRVLEPGDNPAGKPGEGKVVIINNQYDNLGRPSVNYLPYAIGCPTNNCNVFFNTESFMDQIARANEEYDGGDLPDAGEYAFSDKEYEHDPLTTVKVEGLPGVNFSRDEGNVAKPEYSGVNSLDTSMSTLGTDLSDPANNTNPKYAYKYINDAQEYESMEWKDGFGRVVQTAQNQAVPGSPEFVMTRNFYDDRGNLVKVEPPMVCDGPSDPDTNCVNPKLFTYDDENQLIQEDLNDPDGGGKTFFYYDLKGQVRANQTSVQRDRNKLTVTVYDKRDRISYTGEYDLVNFSSNPVIRDEAIRDKVRNEPEWPLFDDPQFTPLSLYFYDDMPGRVPGGLLANYDEGLFRLYPDEVPQSSFQNTQSRLTAVLTFQPRIKGWTTELKNEISSIAFKYDKFGRVLATYTYNSFIQDQTLKMQKVENEYDVNGRQTGTRYFNSAFDKSPSREVAYTYNTRGQLKSLKDAKAEGKPIAEFTYYPTDLKTKEIVLSRDDGSPIHVNFTYHITGAVKEIRTYRLPEGDSIPLYEQTLAYDEEFDSEGAPIPEANRQFNGNISKSINLLFPLGFELHREELYTYDRLNRLTDVLYTVMDGAGDQEFDMTASYDKVGRITSMRRGTKVENTSGGEYHYPPGSFRLSHVYGDRDDGDLRDMSGTFNEPNFTYDQDLRMIDDFSKNMTVTYDFRGMPLEFTQVETADFQKVTAMRYDHDGNRITKMEFSKGFSPGVSDVVIVDEVASHFRHYESLELAYLELDENLSNQQFGPEQIEIYVVVNAEGEVLMPNISQIETLHLQGGEEVPYTIQGLIYNSSEYLDLIDQASTEELTFVKSQHFTGVGNEVRENANTQVAKVITNLPNGLGRFEEGESKLYYLKNHLGSTMLSVKSSESGNHDVYYYHAYGKQRKLMISPDGGEDKITETFTGKELDEGIDLMYFGARYYDQDLALWISPDPSRQFHNLYAFAGNGWNPINSIDPDGRLRTIESKRGGVEGVRLVPKTRTEAIATATLRSTDALLNITGLKGVGVSTAKWFLTISGALAKGSEQETGTKVAIGKAVDVASQPGDFQAIDQKAGKLFGTFLDAFNIFQIFREEFEDVDTPAEIQKFEDLGGNRLRQLTPEQAEDLKSRVKD